MSATTSTNKKLTIFLSHASQDKEAVSELCQKLKADGFDPWLDEERLLPGMDWNLEIEKALRASDTVLLCFSRLSVHKEGYIQREYKRAMRYREEKPEGTIYVIPVRLDDCDLPNFIQEVQCVDYPDGYERLIISLNLRSEKLTSVPPMLVNHKKKPTMPDIPKSGIHIQAHTVEIGGDVINGSKYIYGDHKPPKGSIALEFKKVQKYVEDMPESPDMDKTYIRSFVNDVEKEVLNGKDFDLKRLKTSLRMLQQNSKPVHMLIVALLKSDNLDIDPGIRVLVL